MRNFIFFALTLFILTSCGSKNPKLTGYDFHKTVADDKALVVERSANDSLNVKFCEAQGMFKNDFVKNQKEYEVTFVKSVFQVDSLVYIVTHPEEEYGSEPIVEVYNDIWIGDLYSPIEVNVDLKHAIKKINASDLEAPATPFFVLRRPIVKPPFPEYMYYIFGSNKKGAIKVDSHTGEVTTL